MHFINFLLREPLFLLIDKMGIFSHNTQKK
ncbi:Uncharacterised protein [Yersinia frederiksenii]|nr:Uncharacterised protein [Yersinia frederiksenii]CNG86946.1 Uncharacterised protein [Yersinia frederiksenii]CNL01576.1 Uncharacterised protein [Yersinia frederiksenii]CQH60984.1 Uncharacterised protein [Yersinia frederiksenii]